MQEQIVCPRKKSGDYNMLRCCRIAGHEGECSFVVDSENDYEWNKPKKRKSRTPKSEE